MPELLQLTIDGREVLVAPSAAAPMPVAAPGRLFAAPQMPTGSLALPTDPEVNPA